MHKAFGGASLMPLATCKGAERNDIALPIRFYKKDGLAKNVY